MTKIYGLVWLLVGIAALLVYMTGNWGLRSFYVMGVCCVGLIFIGMIGVLPTTMVGHSKKAGRDGLAEK